MENRQSRRKTKGKRESNFVVQGSILAVAGIIVRLIGILYRVPMTNIIGDEGMGYYSTAFNVYNIMLILSSYSLPLAVSKMVSARMAKGQYRNAVRVLKAALVYATVVGGIACFITWNFADFFATTAFNTPFCVYALKTLAPTIWIMAYLGVLRGFFQGHGTMIPTAISQIFEQVINAVISVVAAGVLFKIGLDSNRVYNTTGYPQAFGAAGGTIGTGAGALAALLFMLLLFSIYWPVVKRRKRRDRSRRTDSYGDISVTFLFTVVPVIISSAVYNINAVVDNSIMAYGMEALGRGKEFLSLWGIYNNKYMLLVHVQLAMANSLLQGINHMNVPVRNAFISLILHIGVLYLMLMVFKMGIYSMVFANIAFAVFMCILNAIAIRRYLNYRQEIVKTFLLPAVASAFMGAAAFGVYKGVTLIIKSNLLGTIFAVLAAIAVYGVLLIKLRCIDEEELYSMPGGTKVIRLSRKLHLM